jgi:hypothetical protein
MKNIIVMTLLFPISVFMLNCGPVEASMDKATVDTKTTQANIDDEDDLNLTEDNNDAFYGYGFYPYYRLSYYPFYYGYGYPSYYSYPYSGYGFGGGRPFFGAGAAAGQEGGPGMMQQQGQGGHPGMMGGQMKGGPGFKGGFKGGDDDKGPAMKGGQGQEEQPAQQGTSEDEQGGQDEAPSFPSKKGPAGKN